MSESFRSSSESNDEEVDNEISIDSPRRNPFDVFKDWLEYRNEKEDDDEKDEDDEDSSKGKISKVFRGLFRRNVEKNTVEGGESNDESSELSYGFLPGVQSLESTPEPDEDITTPEAPRLEAPEPEQSTEESEADQAADNETSEEDDATSPENDLEESDEEGPETEEPQEQDNEDEEDEEQPQNTGGSGSQSTTSAAAAAVNPVAAGGTGNIPPTPPTPPNQGNTPAGPGGNVPPPGTPGGPPPPPGGGSNLPPANPNVIIHTHTERERVVEKKKNGAALAAFVGAEYLSRRRDRKQKERLNDLEDHKEKTDKQAKERQEQLDRIEAEQRKQKAERAQQQKMYERRSVEQPTPRGEKVEPPKEKSEVPAGHEQPERVAENIPRPTNELFVRPQPEAQTLPPEQKTPEFQTEKPEVGMYETSEDIIAKVERMMEHDAPEHSHEIFDERRHEIKDESKARDNDFSNVFGGYAQGQSSVADDTQGQYKPHVTRHSDGSLGTPQQTDTDDLQPGKLLAIWGALIIGFIVALIVILLG